MNNTLLKKFIPVIIFFLFTMVLILVLKKPLISWGFDISFLSVANIILFLLSFFGFFVQMKGATSSNVHAFVRGLYSSLLLKMFVILGAILIYIFVMKGEVNKPALFTSMAFYLIYTSIEVIQLMKIARKKPDA